jgi:hypothetical protein
MLFEISSTWWDFVSERVSNVMVSCSFGILLLMISLACAIALGTSQLVTYPPYTEHSPFFFGATFALIVCSILGGLLTSYGLFLIFNGSRITDNEKQD